MTLNHPVPVTAPQRVGWVDYAKGICIILVVMMHAVNGVEHLFDLLQPS